MSFGWSLEPQARLVRVNYEGPASVAEWLQTMGVIINDPVYAPGFRWLVNRRGAPPVDKNFAHSVARFIENNRANFAGCRVAILISESSTDYGMARMQEALNGFAGLETKAFRSEKHALTWLNL